MFRFPRLIQLSPFFLLVLASLHLQGQATRSATSPQLVLNKARQLFQEGQFQTAVIFVEDYLSSHEAKGLVTKNEAEELAYIRIAGGIIQHEATAVALATAMVNKAENHSTAVKLAYHLGHYHFSLAMYPEAIRFLEMTDRLYLSKEEGQRVAFEKGVSYFSQKKFDNAKPYFKQLLEAESSAYTADVQYYLGFVAFSERQYKEALDWFQAIEKDPRYSLAVPFYLAYIYHENGQDAKAISYGENYLKAGDGLHGQIYQGGGTAQAPFCRKGYRCLAIHVYFGPFLPAAQRKIQCQECLSVLHLRKHQYRQKGNCPVPDCQTLFGNGI